MSNALNFNRIVYFGDSLTDSRVLGELSAQASFVPLPPGAPYVDQYTNGQVYADYVPGLLGVEGGESLNYAIGGTQALTDRTLADLLGPLARPDATAELLGTRVDLDGQIDRFLASDDASGDLSGTAAVVAMGINDFNDVAPDATLEEARAFGESIANKVVGDSQQLADAGVGTLIFHTMHEVQYNPLRSDSSDEERAIASEINIGYNDALRAGAEALEDQGVEVIVVDINALMEEIRNDLSAFGFQSYTESRILGVTGLPTIELNPDALDLPVDQLVFLDGVHPTAETHEIWGVFQAESITSNVIIEGQDNDRIKGTNGDDLVLSSSGNDRVWLKSGDDIALLGLGNDKAFGGRGDDVIGAGSGDDRIFGGKGNDILATNAGKDAAYGGSGDDLLVDGFGRDLLFGGSGDDVFIWTEDALYGGTADGSTDLIVGGSGHDTLIIRVEDASDIDADLGWFGTFFETGLKAFGIEDVVIVEGLELDAELTDQFDLINQAEMWNFV
ncbi:SGNH/GDSL hydrolase family protein [Ruegeria jejuensis]|uniref:SGNH/GDSL hydrolase family protein n=1 Tax=Ruegeria jejuensis TaxID=3233338 RepID=UPI00355BF652